jgi:hypothetical protein
MRRAQRLVSSLALLVAAVGLAGCSEAVNVTVNCVTTATPSVECKVKQVEGKSEVEVCWDFAATCANGQAVTAPRSCTKIKGGATLDYVIPTDKLAGVDKCAGDKPPTITLDNLTIDGKTTTKTTPAAS